MTNYLNDLKLSLVKETTFNNSASGTKHFLLGMLEGFQIDRYF